MPKQTITLNTSVQDIKSSVNCALDNNQLTESSLKEAISSEKKDSNRSSVIKFLQSSLNKLAKVKPTIDGKAEVVGADWTLARQLFEGMILTLRLTLAQQVFLGCELERIKKELGFMGSGRRKKKVAKLATLTWKEHLANEMPDLPDRTADRIISTYHGARTKFKKLGHAKLLTLFDKSPEQLTKTQRTQLETLTSKITDGETQASLLEELKIAKKPKTIEGGNTNNGDDDEDDEAADPVQLALNLWEDPLVELNRVFESSADTLEALPLRGSEEEAEFGEGKCLTLDALAEELEIRAKEAKAVLAARRQP